MGINNWLSNINWNKSENGLNLDESFRYEQKFVISELNFHEIEHLIKHHPKIFSEIFKVRQINNIYLDSVDLENYNHNIDGVAQRIKIRVRWYGKTFGLVNKPFLEIKIKENQIMKKITFPLGKFIFDKEFSSKSLKGLFANSSLQGFLVEKLKSYSPTLLNSYNRKYFISSDKKHRITLDWDQTFFSIGNKNNSFNEQIKDRANSILEIKSSLENHQSSLEIGQHFPFRLIANSKYVCGINIFK
jgi:SPX domain protein involved in polyphosphate accumulation